MAGTCCILPTASVDNIPQAGYPLIFGPLNLLIIAGLRYKLRETNIYFINYCEALVSQRMSAWIFNVFTYC